MLGFYVATTKQPPEMFCKKRFLRNFAKFTGKHLFQSLFFNKFAGLRPATLLKKRFWHKCFPVNFANFLRTPFLIERVWWLLLAITKAITISESDTFQWGTSPSCCQEKKEQFGYDMKTCKNVSPCCSGHGYLNLSQSVSNNIYCI